LGARFRPRFFAGSLFPSSRSRFVVSGSSDSQVRLFDLEDPTNPGVSFGPDACAQRGIVTHDVRCICNCGRRGHSDLVSRCLELDFDLADDPPFLQVRTLQMGKDFVVSGSYDKSVLVSALFLLPRSSTFLKSQPLSRFGIERLTLSFASSPTAILVRRLALSISYISAIRH